MPREIRDVIATIVMRTAHGPTELIVGLDLGRVIRVVAASAASELPERAREQLAFHAIRRPRFAIDADELYLFDLQAVERLPDTPGADDPLYLYGALRGPYPAALAGGVISVEGQLSTSRGPLLDGLALGIRRAFVYEHGAHGARCAHVTLPADREDPAAPRAIVLAFPLVPMGEDATNELVAAQLVHDVLGALRTDLGDDLALDPVPVPSRARYERDLVRAGWKIQGDVAIHRDGKGRLAALFSPGRTQRLPREATLDDYLPLIATHLARLPGWPSPARAALHRRLGIHDPHAVPTAAPPRPTRRRKPSAPPPLPVPARKPIAPPPLPAPARKPTAPPPLPAPARKPTAPPPPVPAAKGPRTKPPPRYESAAPTRPGRAEHKPQPTRGPRTVARGLSDEPRLDWVKEFVDEHRHADRLAPRVTTPARAADDSAPDWMFDRSDEPSDDDP